MLKLGIIGCGRIVEFAHVDALKRLAEEVEVAALSDPSEVRLETVGGMLQIGADHRYEDYREMLKREDLDFVDIAVPPFLHEKVLLGCAAQLPVYARVEHSCMNWKHGSIPKLIMDTKTASPN